MDRTCIMHLMDETYVQNVAGYPEGKEDLEKLSGKVVLSHIKV
jgi:hypothetical protein